MLKALKKFIPATKADKEYNAMVRLEETKHLQNIHEILVAKITVHENTLLQRWLKSFNESGLRTTVSSIQKDFKMFATQFTDILAENEVVVHTRLLAAENSNVLHIEKDIINYDLYSSDECRRKFTALEKRIVLQMHALTLLRTHPDMIKACDVDIQHGFFSKFIEQLEYIVDLYTQILINGSKYYLLDEPSDVRIRLMGNKDIFDRVAFTQ